MYTYSEAIADSIVYLNTSTSKHLLKTVGGLDKVPLWSEVKEAVCDVYAMIMRTFLFSGECVELYKEKVDITDNIYLPKIIASKLIPTLVLFYFCKKFRCKELKELRAMIMDLINLLEIYIEDDEVTIEDYNNIKSLEI